MLLNSIPFLKNYRVALKEKRNFLRFEVHVTEHCNLNCKSCGHMSPLAKSEFLDLDIYYKNIERLSYLCDRKVELVDLMGGGSRFCIHI